MLQPLGVNILIERFFVQGNGSRFDDQTASEPDDTIHYDQEHNVTTISELERVSNLNRRQSASEVAGPRHHARLASAIPDSIEHSVRRTVQLSVQRYVHGLDVRLQKDAVIVSGRAGSYYHRQLAEQCVRLIIVEHLDKRLVSEIVVSNDLSTRVTG